MKLRHNKLFLILVPNFADGSTTYIFLKKVWSYKRIKKKIPFLLYSQLMLRLQHVSRPVKLVQDFDLASSSVPSLTSPKNVLSLKIFQTSELSCLKEFTRAIGRFWSRTDIYYVTINHYFKIKNQFTFNLSSLYKKNWYKVSKCSHIIILQPVFQSYFLFFSSFLFQINFFVVFYIKHARAHIISFKMPKIKHHILLYNV